MSLNGVMRKYLKKTKRPLSGYRIYKQKVKIKKKAYLAVFLFFMAAIYHLLERFNIVDFDINFTMTERFLAFLAAILLVVPLIHIHLRTGYKVLLTHDAIVMQNLFKQYRLMFIADITKAKLSKKNVLSVRGKRHKFKIKMPNYEDNLNVVKDILNYEGHFKQKKKPYKLFFEVEGVEIQELTPSIDPTTRRLLESFLDDYKHVTPGFIDDVILFNSIIEKVRFIEERHAIFYLSHIDLKADYPENTSFDAQKTDPAVVIFQDVSHVEIFSLGKENHDTDVQLLGTSIATLRKISKTATIIETNFKKLDDRISTDMIILQSSKKQRIRFVFKEIIVGFNEFKGRSWFEKK